MSELLNQIAIRIRSIEERVNSELNETLSELVEPRSLKRVPISDQSLSTPKFQLKRRKERGGENETKINTWEWLEDNKYKNND